MAFTYYGISLNITGFGLNVYLTQLIFASIEVPMKIGVYLFLKKIGRKPGEVASLVLTGVCLLINIFITQGIDLSFHFYHIQSFEKYLNRNYFIINIILFLV